MVKLEKMMLAVLCLIALVLDVGAQYPASATDKSDDLIGLLNKIRYILVKEIGKGHLKEKGSSQEYPRSSNEGYTPESADGAAASSSTKSPLNTTAYVTPEGQEETNKNEHTLLVGSIRGMPGVHFPAYTEIPITSFDCASKAYIPGFYADLETGCQVFHVCWHHRRESFLCPVGTIFNQAILACDFWYSSNCSLASYYYNINAQYRLGTPGKESKTMSMIDVLLAKDGKESTSPTDFTKLKKADLSYILKFLPVKAKVTVYPETTDSRSKIVAETSIGKGKKTQHIRKAIKTPMTQVLEQEFIPVGRENKVTSPQLQQKTAFASEKEKAAYAHDGLKSAAAIVHEVLDLVGSILRETRGIYSSVSSAKQSQSQVHKPASTRKRPLTKLNPRFITKRAEVLETDMNLAKPAVIPNKGQTQAGVSKATQTSKVYPSSTSRKLTVSTTTKQVLAQNYLRLLLRKSA